MSVCFTKWKTERDNDCVFTCLSASLFPLLLCVYTPYNLFAHSSCTSLLILLFIKSTVYCIAHFTLLYILLLFCHLIYIFFYLYLCLSSCVVLYILHCPLSGPDLTYISLLIIFCIIEYGTNKNLDIDLDLDLSYPVLIFTFFFSLFAFCVHEARSQMRSEWIIPL